MPDVLDDGIKANLNMNDVLSGMDDDKSDDTSTNDNTEELKLNEEDTEDSDDSDDESEEEQSEEETSDDDSEDEESEETEENQDELKLEDEDPDKYADIPTRKTIIAKYPKFFKEFPGVERAMFREQKYSEIFPSIKDAESARDSLGVYQNVENDLQSGNIAPLLNAVKTGNEKAFKRIAGTFLNQIQKVDESSYYGIVNSVLKQALVGISKAAKEMDDPEQAEQYQLAAALVHKALYNTSKVTPFQMEVPDDKVDPKEEQLNQRELNYQREQLSRAVTAVDERLDRTVKTAIEKNIDPKQVMPEYLRGKAVEDTWNKLNRIISNDKRFVNYRDSLWREAAKDNYSERSLTAIRREILKKAQSILPDVIRQVRADAMKGLSRVPTRKLRKEESEQPNENRRSAAPRNQNSFGQRQNNNPRPRANSVNDVMKFIS